jgi:peptidoglycan/LPS O-acetylase OafA/YrhL
MSAHNSSFDFRLESLRGVAALAVLISHASAVLPVDGLSAYWSVPIVDQSRTAQQLTLLTAVLNPGVAVILFFILSGYVLALSLADKRDPGVTRAYAVRRLFRLLPAMWVSIAFMWFCLEGFRRPDSFAPYASFFVSVFGGPIDAGDAAANAVLWAHRVNRVTWTMAVEVSGSAYVPVSIFVTMRYGRGWAWGLLLAAFIATCVTQPSNYLLHYIFCFQIGVMLSANREAARPALGWVSPPMMLSLALAALVVQSVFAVALPLPARTLCNTGIAFLLLVAVLRGAADRILLASPTRMIGQVSYSLYLFHLPVLYGAGRAAVALGFVGAGWAPHLLIIFFGLCGGLAIASVSFWLIERPSIAVGRRLAVHVQNWAAGRVIPH